VSGHRDEHLDLCAARLIGGIEEADRLELERHLASGCDICEAALAEMGGGIERLAASVPAASPSPRVRANVLTLIKSEGAPARGAASGSSAVRPRILELPERRRSRWPLWGLATAAALLLVSAVISWRAAGVLRNQLAESQQQVADAGKQLSESRQQLAEERAWASLATNPGARVIELAATPAGTALPRVRAIYDPSSRKAIVAFENLVTPAGSDFELWTVQPDGPHSLGVVRPDAQGRAEVRIPDAGDPKALAAFALSLERAGGSGDPRKPGGPVVMAGVLKVPPS
jgi:anti-sigma-K factor RskA